TNPNLTVFEWLNRMPEFQGKVAVYATWNTFKDIFNEKRSGLVMQAGWDLPEKGNLTPRQELLNQLYQTTTQFDGDDVFNSFVQVPLLDYVKADHPRVLFVGYGETDNWAHQGRYDLVLESAREFDRDVEELWTTMQAMPEYRGKTTFIITTDHGRGSGLVDWKEHGVDEKGSENVWIAVMGPDTPALGERGNVGVVTQAQIAATVAQVLGKDWRGSARNAAGALPVFK
ncbi:MAG TPA: alkaline phosphatase family protein, partial [Gemmatimonadaceae bacterium]|nr:alkaline phosphatase family protein [Gemmatimonadaceae bacterium]